MSVVSSSVEPSVEPSGELEWGEPLHDEAPPFEEPTAHDAPLDEPSINVTQALTSLNPIEPHAPNESSLEQSPAEEPSALADEPVRSAPSQPALAQELLSSTPEGFGGVAQAPERPRDEELRESWSSAHDEEDSHKLWLIIAGALVIIAALTYLVL